MIAFPLLLGAAIAIRWREGPPVLYRSIRVGKDGERFNLLKLRTMTVGARNHSLGSVTVAGDNRITATGRVLRRWKLDELPQILNVLAGHMSLVGPRPDTPDIVDLYTPAQREVLRYRPGLTSPASIRFVDEAELLAAADDPRRLYLEQIMPEELRIDLEYMRRATPASDLRVLLRTVTAVLWGKNA